MNGELLRRMIRGFYNGDPEAFRTACEQLVKSERKQGHTHVADDLERELNNGGFVGKRPIHRVGTTSSPRSKAEGVPLVEIRFSERSLFDIVLTSELKTRITRFLEEFSKRDLLSKYGLEPKKRLLFFGPPGNGKTLCAEVVAGELGLPLFYVRFDSLVGSYLGETAANLRKVFDYAEEGLGILLFDEFDAIGKSRDDRTDVGELKRVVNSFLQLLDNYRGKSPIIAATNYDAILDYAIWRRFDDLIFFPCASQQQLVSYFYQRLAPFELTGFTANEAADWCEGGSFSDASRIVTEAVKTMVLENNTALTARMFVDAVQQFKVAEAHRSEHNHLGETQQSRGAQWPT